MKDMLYILGAAFIFLFATVLLKECGWHGAKAVAVGCVVALFAIAAKSLGEIVSSLWDIGDAYGISDTVSLVVRAVGISYVFGISADICRDMGEGGIGGALDTAGRLELTLLSLPLIREIAEMGVSFIGG